MAQAYTLGVCWTLQARDPTTFPLCLETTRSETETVSGRSPVAQSCVACVFVHSVPRSVYRVCAPKSFELMLNDQRPSRLFEKIAISITGYPYRSPPSGFFGHFQGGDLYFWYCRKKFSAAFGGGFQGGVICKGGWICRDIL